MDHPLSSSLVRTYVESYFTFTKQLVHRHRISTAVALAVVGLYISFSNLTRGPRDTRHIPRIDFLKYVHAILKKKSREQIAQQVNLPTILASETGLYMGYDQNQWCLHIAMPKHVKHILMNQELFPKGDPITTRKGTLLGRFAFGPNLVTLEGEKWKQHRMIANPAFRRSLPVGMFGNLCEKLFSVMGDNGTKDFRGLSERFALDAIGFGGFGFDFNAVLDQNSPWVVKYLDIISAGFDPFFLVFSIFDKKLRFLFPSRVRAHQQLSEFLLKMREIIDYKRRTLETSRDTIKDSEKDLLQLMIEAEKDGEAALTDDELMSNLCVFFIAGHDTTANSMACAAYYLAKNPDIQAKAREEAIRILGDEPKDIFPSIDQTRQMRYITMIVKETLRLNPPLPNASFRVAAKDTVIDGVLIPKGTRIQVDIYESQHNPRVWQDPETFRPERFEADGEADHIEGFGWVPFGNGTRQCIGMNFSLTEQRVFLSMLLRKYELSLPRDTIHANGIVTHGMPVSAPLNMQITYKNRY